MTNRTVIKPLAMEKVPSLLISTLPIGLENPEVYPLKNPFTHFLVKGVLDNNTYIDYFFGIYTLINGKYYLFKETTAAPDCQDTILHKTQEEQIRELLLNN